jgi:hypothetical protein
MKITVHTDKTRGKEMQMATISLAKALKLKNRLAGRMAKVQSNASTYNSTLDEQRDQMDVPMLLKEREEIMEALISLKASIQRANAPIQEMILRKGELSSKIEWLNTVNTTDGAVRHGYQNTEVKYVAVIKKKDQETMVRALEKEIDAIQDKIDEFNAGQRVEVAQRVLDLASAV